MSLQVIIGLVVTILITLNVILTSLKKLLDRVAANSEADAIVGKIAGFMSAIVGFLTANYTNLPQAAQDALKGDSAPAGAAPAASPAAGS